MDFEFRGLPWNVVFGAGTLSSLPAQLARLRYERPLILTTPGRKPLGRNIVEMLGPSSAECFTSARTHTPKATVDQAMALADTWNADCTVAVGGGSTIGLGKALALLRNTPNVAVPTTYSGSEMTNIWGYLEGRSKQIGRDDKVLPRLTIYDPNLTLDLPAEVSGASGLNAIAQAVVNVTMHNPNPILVLWALEAIRSLAGSLPRIIENPRNIVGRTRALYGACLAGAVIGAGQTSLHHRLCHVFGGMFDTPHAQTHALFLPHSVLFNSSAVPEATALVADALGVGDAAKGLRALADELHVPRSLRELGIVEQDLDEAAHAVLRGSVNNPRPVQFDSIRRLLQDAFDGVLRIDNPDSR